MTAWGWDVGKRVGGRFCTSASFSAAVPGVDTGQAYGRHPVTHSTQSWLSTGGHGLHGPLAPSAVMYTLRKALLLLAGASRDYFIKQKDCNDSAVPCPFVLPV